MNKEDIKEYVNALQGTRVKVAVSDIDGVLCGKYMHKDKFLSAVDNGFGFCSVIFGWDAHDEIYDTCKVSSWDNGFPDMQAHLDLNTFRNIPWDGDTPFFLADFSNSNIACCPRNLLKKVIKKSNNMGFEPKVGLEFEWFNFRESLESLYEKGFDNLATLTPGMFGYSLTRKASNVEFFESLFDDLEQYGVPLEGLHTETGPGVLEAAIKYSGALEAADRGTLFKGAVKEIGIDFGIMPTFMARPHKDLPGCSGHMHQSLVETETGRNVFYDGSKPNRMSDLFKHYVAGQLKLMPELASFFAPTANSYRRLVEGFWAPTRSNWGVDNRTCALRVLNLDEKSCRVEFRTTGSDTNSYLAVAASLAAGLWGIENKLELTQEALTGNGYKDVKNQQLPKDLSEAATRLSDSAIAKAILGEDFVEHYVGVKKWEAQKTRDMNLIDERRRYFEII